MFNKLRNNYVMTNMLLIGSIITISFISVFYISYKNSINSIYTNLDEQASQFDLNDKLQVGQDPMISYILFDEKDDEKMIHGPLKYEVVDDSLFVNKIIESSQKEKIVKFEDRYYASRTYHHNTNYFSNAEAYTLIVDVTNIHNSLLNLLLVMLLILLIVLGLVFVVCVYLANKSVEQLKIAWDKQRQFIGDASHELKTPLAIIDANMDALSVSTNNQWTQNIKSETERMATLLSELLYLTKIDDYDLAFNNTQTDFSNIVNTVLIANEALVFEKGLCLEKNVAENISITCDEEKLKQLVHILVDNAIRYSNDHIMVALKQEFNTITFSVENTGQGIAEDKLHKVFDRFYKGDESRLSNDQSYGLGLSIAQAIVLRMGGDIYAQSVINEKTKFTIIFQV